VNTLIKFREDIKLPAASAMRRLLVNGFQHREMSNVSAKRVKTSKYSISMEAGDMRWLAVNLDRDRANKVGKQGAMKMNPE